LTTAVYAAEWTVGPDKGKPIQELRLPWTKFIPVQPTPKQLAFLLLPTLEALFGGAAGPGKLLSLRTPIPTPYGWTSVGQLQVGEQVFGDDGLPCAVEWLSDIDLMPESFRVVFDDGSVIEACGDHLWLTYDAKELAALTRRDPEWRAKRRSKRNSRATFGQGEVKSLAVAARNRLHPPPALPPPMGTLRTTGEIAATLTVSGGRSNHAIPVAKALELPKADLPLDPYVFGAWLGDGTTLTGQITTGDVEIIHEIEAAGWKANKVPSSPYAWRIVGLTARLRDLGLLGEKSIPSVYMRGSIEQRRALLQGLMDTDGTCGIDGRVEFTNTNQRLAHAVYELAASLGQKPTINEGRAKLNGRDCGPVWDVAWTPTLSVFRIPRKVERQHLNTRRTNRFRYVTSCSRIPSRPMRCIRVSNPSGLFLVGRSMIPTHNSVGLLMTALQYADTPGYAALLLRKSYSDLSLPGALMDKAAGWLGGTSAAWKAEEKTWRFPSGATLTFGYLDNAADKYRYQSSEFQFIGFDELTQFQESDYRYMFSRLRRLANSDTPIRMRAASNPGNIGHEWVKQRFMVENNDDRVFLPARISDNPHLDQAEYEKSLAELDPITRAQLLKGDWTARAAGDKFRREWFEIVEAAPNDCRFVRRWDMAATEAKPGKDPDWTAGVLIGLSKTRTLYIADIKRLRGTPGACEALVKQTAQLDGKAVAIRMEQEPGSSGVKAIDDYTRRVLMGYDFKGFPSTGNKEVRANPLSSQAQAGNVKLVRGPWINAFLDEAEIFPRGAHDDQVDAASGALSDLTSDLPDHLDEQDLSVQPAMAGLRGRAF
jgi:predicted phage terminase large subunit-like protein